jgi:hypothetical protein
VIRRGPTRRGPSTGRREARAATTATDAGAPGDIRRAIPLAIASALVGVASLLTTVFVAHVLTTRGYGTLVVLLGLFLVISMPGSALLVGVVRRVTAWEAGGFADRVRPWVGRVHRTGQLALVALAVVTWLLRVPVAHALSLPGPSGVMEILTAGGVWVLVSIDRGLLQVRQSYVALSVNLVLEATMRTVVTVVLAKEFGVEGAALGLLLAELVTAAHARITSTRTLATPPAATVLAATPPAATVLAAEPAAATAPALWATATAPALWATPPAAPVIAAESRVTGVEGTGATVALTAHRGRDLAADVVTALASLALLAVLQNADVILLGSKAPHRSGAYAAISVPSKALVFGALVFVNYLLPEATIRHQRGSHALRQLGHTLVVVAVPCAVLLALAVAVPRRLLGVVFGHRLTAAAPAFSTLVLAMILLSVTVVLTVYLLGVGWRWVAVILAAGAGALAASAALAGGRYLSTARADLAVQAGLCAVMVVAFVVAHRRSSRRRPVAMPAGRLPAG